MSATTVPAAAVFTSSWLALREPADRAARNPEVLQACCQAFAGQDALTICDLGAGAGASVRAFAPLLPARQRWVLVDRDQSLLSAAAPPADNAGVTVETMVRELADGPVCWPTDARLVTASALLDLVSADWIARLAAGLVAQQAAVLATLTFDGLIALDPAHPLDDAVSAAFCAHQKRDKGFGPAAGPEAATVFEGFLRRGGFDVVAGDSPWRIGATADEFMRQTLTGIAGAAREMALGGAVDAWLEDRLRRVRWLTIGHRDIFACPSAVHPPSSDA